MIVMSSFLLEWCLDYYVVSFLISCNLYFKVCFVWYEDCYSIFLLLPVCMEYIFSILSFFSLYVSRGLNGYKNKTHIYAVYKKPTSDLKTHIDWKWEDGKRYSMQIGRKKKAGIAILISDKIDLKIKKLQEIRKDTT